MRVLFWNINGVARDVAQDKLKELIREFKPDIFGIAEPKVPCSAGKQAITVEVDGVHVSFVHASYIQVTRRSLWQQLVSSGDGIPWLVIGYFNCILRLDEKKGGLEPRTSAINEFSDWLDDNNLFEANALGSKFTWTNKQSGKFLTILLFWVPFAVPRPKRAPFRVQKMWFLHSDFLRMVRDSWSMSISGSLDFIFTQKLKRLKGVIKEWNLRVFGNFHSRLKQDQLRFEAAALLCDENPDDITKLNIMKDTMAKLNDTRAQLNIMLNQKYRNKWLVKGSSNTNFFHNNIRIRRSSNTISELVDSAGNTISDFEQLRNHVVHYYEDKFNGPELEIDPILFDYDHISISEEESLAMDRIPSSEEIKQAVFDLGADSAPGPDGFSGCFYRHCWDIIQDDLLRAVIYCWNSGHIPNGLNSSLIVLIPKVRGANSLRNFRPIGLSNFFFKIFTKILDTRLGSVLDKVVSEEQMAFMKRRNIHENISLASELINELHINRKDGNFGLKLDITQAFDTVSWSFVLEVFRRINRGLRQGDPLSPLIFVLMEDVLSRNITKLFAEKRMSYMDLLGKYQCASGQSVCRQKSKIYYGGGSLSGRNYVVDYLGMSVATFPDRYFGFQIMPGAVSRAVVVAYDKICCPFEEGGLALSRMATMNFAMLMKLWWKISTSKKNWAGYLKAKFLVEEATLRLMGSTSLYYDVWYGEKCFAEILDDFTLDRLVLVSDCYRDNQWVFPENHLNCLLAAGVDMHNLPLPDGGEDKRVWMPNFSGDFSVSSAKELIRQKHGSFNAASMLWRKEIHPRLAAQNWKFIRGACATLDIIQSRFKIHLANKCVLCETEEESLEHILFHCSFAARAWSWISGIFGMTANFNIVASFKAAKGRSAIVHDLWLVANLVIRSELWAMRNKCIFEKQKPGWGLFSKRVLKLIQEYSVRLKGFMRNSVEDMVLLDYFRVVHRSVRHQQPIEVLWQPPELNEILICCDGAARRNPGIAGSGVVARDSSCAFLGALSIGLGITTNYLAELYAIIIGMEWAMQCNYDRICVQSDSYGVVQALQSSSIPWFARARWERLCNHYISIRIIHTYREANFSADKMAKNGCYLDNEVGIQYEGRPDFLISVENPNVSYFRFK
ncbi:uncharacterized protein LOC113356677 [Papaver somniferum]|uniref:uncharacterized protein LOC113356677 n=1 Tax=Papaver somniferum TaxID=3469 RepID=UPI000E6F8A0E|nr:uncharacterized protein LOC113356677 [Papaver somniferum]